MKSIQIKGLQFIFVAFCLVLATGLSACNGGAPSTSSGVSSENNSTTTVTIPTDIQNRIPASAYTLQEGLSLSATASASGNSCFSLVATPNGRNYTTAQNSQPYYSTATASFTLQNTCSSAQALSGLIINVNNLTLNGKAAAINYIAQSQSNPFLTLTYTSSANNVVLNVSSPACSGNYCSWASMHAGAKNTFTLNAFVNAAINSLLIDGISISGSMLPPTPTPGSLALNVNSTALTSLCPSVANCKIGVNLLDPTGVVIQSIKVNPAESPNYTVIYKNLLAGNYTFVVDTNSYPSAGARSISYTSVPINRIAQVNSGMTTNSSVTFGYTAPIQTGSLIIKSAKVTESASFANLGALSGTATNTKTKQVYSFSIPVNGSYTLNNLPANDIYSVGLQGIADAASGVYYSVPTVSTIVVANGSSNVNLAFNKVTSSQHSVAFVVSGNPVNQTITFADTNAAFKYAVNPLKTATYKFLVAESAVAVTLVTPTGYTLSYTPAVITPSVKTFTATYNAIIPPSLSGLTTSNDKIIDANNNEVILKGINWFGFNNSDMLNGMWNYDGLSGDFETTVLRLKALGFNAVRLPFTFAILNGAIQSTYNRNNLAPASKAQLIVNLSNPAYSITGKNLPALSYTSGQSYVNQYLPNTNVMARFIYVINFFAKNGFYVLIDNHSEDNSMTSNQAAWIANWKSLSSTINNGMPVTSSNRVMYDLRNEPDAVGYNWTQMGPLYLATMDAINSVTKGNNLFFIEGSGQGGAGANWGDGFVTNQALIQQNGLSNPNSFFQSLASKSYLNQVVLSPHVYPPSVTNAGSNFSGNGLYTRLSNSFGSLAKTGYCVAGVCHRFPIAIGEFGSNFVLANDLLFFSSFANYLNNTNDAVDGLHNPIQSWFYWSYNPNSGDTGGIVKNDWTTIEWTKLNYLSNGSLSNMNTTNSNGLGLSPWYK